MRTFRLQPPGVFLLTACANHDCAPTLEAAAGPDGASASLCLRTTRAVQRGDELTLSYVGAGPQPRHERQRLLAHWGVDCVCARCVEEGAGGGAEAEAGGAVEVEEEVVEGEAE